MSSSGRRPVPHVVHRPGDGQVVDRRRDQPGRQELEAGTEKPVLSAEAAWEKVAVMCPHVIYDDEQGRYHMWYSGGEQYEPNAIGYATSPTG